MSVGTHGRKCHTTVAQAHWVDCTEHAFAVGRSKVRDCVSVIDEYLSAAYILERTP